MGQRSYQVVDLDQNTIEGFGSMKEALDFVDELHIPRYRITEDDHDVVVVDRIMTESRERLSAAARWAFGRYMAKVKP